MRNLANFFLQALILSVLLAGCREAPVEPLPPDAYLDNALSWIRANALLAEDVNWEQVEQEARALVHDPQTTADTYPAIEYALAQLGDYMAWLTPPGDVSKPVESGIVALYPENIVVHVMRGSPGDKAGVQTGDEVVLVAGAPPGPTEERANAVDFPMDWDQSLAVRLRRGTEELDVTLTAAEFPFEGRPAGQVFPLGARQAGYLELASDTGTELYPTEAQAVLSQVDGPTTCGWIIDLRRNRGGDLWTYFAALGPILGEGELGGFVYADGSREMWRYADEKVYWAGEERFESYVRGPVAELANPAPAVALLTSSITEAAGELVVAAFRGWGNVRTFGETTLGTPTLVLHTPLSDGALMFVSGAWGMDRTGRVYNGPIQPDEPVQVDWRQFGGADDPVIAAALEWLVQQPECTP